MVGGTTEVDAVVVEEEEEEDVVAAAVEVETAAVVVIVAKVDVSVGVVVDRRLVKDVGGKVLFVHGPT